MQVRRSPLDPQAEGKGRNPRQPEERGTNSRYHYVQAKSPGVHVQSAHSRRRKLEPVRSDGAWSHRRGGRRKKRRAPPHVPPGPKTEDCAADMPTSPSVSKSKKKPHESSGSPRNQRARSKTRTRSREPRQAQGESSPPSEKIRARRRGTEELPAQNRPDELSPVLPTEIV
jgi:hypothetical protein